MKYINIFIIINKNNKFIICRHRAEQNRSSGLSKYRIKQFFATIILRGVSTFKRSENEKKNINDRDRNIINVKKSKLFTLKLLMKQLL